MKRFMFLSVALALCCLDGPAHAQRGGRGGGFGGNRGGGAPAANFQRPTAPPNFQAQRPAVSVPQQINRSPNMRPQQAGMRPSAFPSQANRPSQLPTQRPSNVNRGGFQPGGNNPAGANLGNRMPGNIQRPAQPGNFPSAQPPTSLPGVSAGNRFPTTGNLPNIGGISRPQPGATRPNDGFIRPLPNRTPPTSGGLGDFLGMDRPIQPSTRPGAGGAGIQRPGAGTGGMQRPGDIFRPGEGSRPGAGGGGVQRPGDVLRPGDITRPGAGGGGVQRPGDVLRPGESTRPGEGGGGVQRPGDIFRPGDKTRPGEGGGGVQRPGEGTRPGQGGGGVQRPIDRPDRPDNRFPRPNTNRPVINRPVNVGNQINTAINRQPSWVNINNTTINNIHNNWNSAVVNRPMNNWWRNNPRRYGYWNGWANGVRGNWAYWHGGNWFGPNWWYTHRYPYGGWHYHWWFPYYPYSYWWTVPTWAGLTSWFSWNTAAMPVWSNPIVYDYGPGGNVTYQDNSVYIAGQPVATTANFAESAAALATVPPPPSDEAAAQAEWMPLGTFALSTGEKDTEPNRVLQLAVTKDGIIGGTLFNNQTEQSQAIQGKVDKETQRVAFRIGDRESIVAETGLYNLTQDEVPLLVHFGTMKNENYLLIRMKDPQFDQAQMGSTNSSPEPTR